MLYNPGFLSTSQFAASKAPNANKLLSVAVCENSKTSVDPAKITVCSPMISPPSY